MFHVRIPTEIAELFTVAAQPSGRVLMSVKPNTCVLAASPWAVVWTENTCDDVSDPVPVAWSRFAAAAKAGLVVEVVVDDQGQVTVRDSSGATTPAVDDEVPVWRLPPQQQQQGDEPSIRPPLEGLPDRMDLHAHAPDGSFWAGYRLAGGVLWFGWMNQSRTS